MLDYIILDLTAKFFIIYTILLIYRRFKKNIITGFFFITIVSIATQIYIKPISNFLLNIQSYQESYYINISIILASLFILPIIYNFKPIRNNWCYINNLNVKEYFLLFLICEIILFATRLKFLVAEYSRVLDVIITATYFIIYILFMDMACNYKYKLIIFYIVFDIILSVISGNSSFKNVMLIALACAISSKNINKNVSNLIFPCIIILAVSTNLWFENKILLKYTISNLDLIAKLDYIYNSFVLIPETSLTSLVDKIIDRVGYIEFISQCIQNVPSFHDFEYGSITLDSINRLLMPSFLYTDKPIINDSLRTNNYLNNYHVIDVEKNSIGLGYVAELYIDFGVGIILLGIITSLLINKMYTNFAKHNLIPSIDFSLFFNFYLIEQSITKILPAFVHTLIISSSILIIYDKYITKKK